MHEEVGTEGRWVPGKGVGSNSSSLLTSEGLLCSTEVNLHSHLHEGKGNPAAGTLLRVGVREWRISGIWVSPERREET